MYILNGRKGFEAQAIAVSTQSPFPWGLGGGNLGVANIYKRIDHCNIYGDDCTKYSAMMGGPYNEYGLHKQ